MPPIPDQFWQHIDVSRKMKQVLQVANEIVEKIHIEHNLTYNIAFRIFTTMIEQMFKDERVVKKIGEQLAPQIDKGSGSCTEPENAEHPDSNPCSGSTTRVIKQNINEPSHVEQVREIKQKKRKPKKDKVTKISVACFSFSKEVSEALKVDQSFEGKEEQQNGDDQLVQAGNIEDHLPRRDLKDLRDISEILWALDNSVTIAQKRYIESTKNLVEHIWIRYRYEMSIWSYYFQNPSVFEDHFKEHIRGRNRKDSKGRYTKDFIAIVLNRIPESNPAWVEQIEKCPTKESKAECLKKLKQKFNVRRLEGKVIDRIVQRFGLGILQLKLPSWGILYKYASQAMQSTQEVIDLIQKSLTASDILKLKSLDTEDHPLRRVAQLDTSILDAADLSGNSTITTITPNPQIFEQPMIIAPEGRIKELEKEGKIKEENDTGQAVETYMNLSGRATLVKCFLEGEWLNCDAINGYLEHLQKEVTEKKVFLHLTYFASHLLSHGPTETAQTWYVNRYDHDFSKTSYCLIPVNINNNHWIAIFADLKKRILYFFDSMAKRGPVGKDKSKIGHYLTEFYQIRTDDKKEWNIHFKSECPQQNNLDDCGMHVLMLADWLLKHPEKVDSLSKNLFSLQDVKLKRKELHEFFLQQTQEKASRDNYTNMAGVSSQPCTQKMMEEYTINQSLRMKNDGSESPLFGDEKSNRSEGSNSSPTPSGSRRMRKITQIQENSPITVGQKRNLPHEEDLLAESQTQLSQLSANSVQRRNADKRLKNDKSMESEKVNVEMQSSTNNKEFESQTQNAEHDYFAGEIEFTETQLNNIDKSIQQNLHLADETANVTSVQDTDADVEKENIFTWTVQQVPEQKDWIESVITHNFVVNNLTKTVFKKRIGDNLYKSAKFNKLWSSQMVNKKKRLSLAAEAQETLMQMKSQENPIPPPSP